MWSQLLKSLSYNSIKLVETPVSNGIIQTSYFRFYSFKNQSKRPNTQDNNKSSMQIKHSHFKRSKPKDDGIIRVSSINSRTTDFYRKFRVPKTLDEDTNNNKDYIFDNHEKSGKILDNYDPDSLNKLEEDLELYSRDEELYHEKAVDEDIRMKRRIKIGIIKKKMAKLEGNEQNNFNLLTWDAKEQIKYLNSNEPG